MQIQYVSKTYVNMSSKNPGAAAEMRESAKHTKYKELVHSYLC